MLLASTASVCAVWGCSVQKPFGSRGPGEIWMMSNPIEDPTKAAESEQQVEEFRSWGWASQRVHVVADESVDALGFGPMAQSMDVSTIKLNYFMIGPEPISGMFRINAFAESGYELPREWADEIVYSVESDQQFASGNIVLPVLGVPVYGVTVVWEGDR